MKGRLITAVFAALIAFVNSQDDPPRPVEPVLRRTPANCSWTVRHKHEYSEQEDSWEKAFGEEGAPVGGGAGLVDSRRVERRRIEKNAKLMTYHLRTWWSDGETQDDWVVMGRHVAERAGDRGLYVAGAESTMADELEKADFPELGWLGMKYYRGLKTWKGKPVFVFKVPFNEKPMTIADRRYYNFVKQTNPKATPKDVFNPKYDRVVAYLDAKTQLPVLYNDGKVLRRYAFAQPGSYLRPPQKIVDFLRKREAFLEKRTATPAAPGGDE